MEQEEVAKFVTVAPAGFHVGQHAVAFRVVQRYFQAGRCVVLGVHRQDKGENNAISFLTGHVIHLLPGAGR